VADYKTTTPNQVRKNQVITADLLNSIIDSLMNRIIGGKGVIVRRVGQNIIIELEERFR